MNLSGLSKLNIKLAHESVIFFANNFEDQTKKTYQLLFPEQNYIKPSG